MKNIHVLPTDKARLYIHQGKLYDNKKTMHIPDGKQIPHHICITNDEEIKEGDWCYYENGDLKGIHKVVNGQRPKTMILKKIILSTDQDLIKDGVQAISDEFIELFVKNLNCERVEVERLQDGQYIDWLADGSVIEGIYENYKITIPQEKYKQTDENGKPLTYWGGLEEPIPETIEEALNYQLNFIHDVVRNKDFDLGFQTGGIFGAKWQAERMYSEEEPDYDKIKEALVEMRKIPMTFSPDERMYSEEEVVNLIEDWTKMAEGLNLNFPSGKFNNWFEQFKKK
jgi:hypothetical protein